MRLAMCPLGLLFNLDQTHFCNIRYKGFPSVQHWYKIWLLKIRKGWWWFRTLLLCVIRRVYWVNIELRGWRVYCQLITSLSLFLYKWRGKYSARWWYIMCKYQKSHLHVVYPLDHTRSNLNLINSFCKNMHKATCFTWRKTYSVCHLNNHSLLLISLIQHVFFSQDMGYFCSNA